jgi:3-hydroxyacyl-[acyl-carrier-protein] dehydratase
MDKLQIHEKKRFISLSAATTSRLLPQAYPFMLLDRIRACYPEDCVGYSIKNITLTDPVLAGHFPGFPIYPGVMVIEALTQNACMTSIMRDLYRKLGSYEAMLEFVAQIPASGPETAFHYFLAESRVKHIEAIYPGDTVDLEAKLTLERDGVMVFKVGATVENRDVARGQLTVVRTLSDKALSLGDRIG